MASPRQTITNALLTACPTCLVTGFVLAADDHVVPATALFVVGAAALASGLWLMFHQRRKRLVIPREVADVFARSGSIMGEPPRYDSSLRKKP